MSIDASSTAVLVDHGPARFLDLVAGIGARVLLTNAAEAALLGIGERAPEHVDIVVVHRGGGPATAATRDGVVASIDPPEVREAADTTGAGDAFAAGFLPEFARGATLDAALAAGHRAAARTLDVAGAGVEGHR